MSLCKSVLKLFLVKEPKTYVVNSKDKDKLLELSLVEETRSNLILILVKVFYNYTFNKLMSNWKKTCVQKQ